MCRRHARGDAPGRAGFLEGLADLIDLHFHCLPGIDDGPASWDDAVALCRAAAADGITSIVATPHVLRENWINDDEGVRDELVLKLNTLLGGKPAILPGCEYWFSAEVLDLLGPQGDEGAMGATGPVTRLNRSRYLLVEFPAGQVMESAEAVFHELSVLDIVPVIAHPERNMVLSRDPERLARLMERGALSQVTAASVLGEFGARAQHATEEFLRLGLVSVIASDSHSVKVRPPRMTAAREKVRKHWGAEVEQALFVANPEAIVRSAPLPWPAA
ncbi:MAG: CpsB/CapC family capsule biosynthesis tyrosine phosphatase [Thermoanaerobaculia bacterium]